jgi:uncharacterized protein
MKFLLLFFIFMLLAFQWRQARAAKVKRAARKDAAAAGAVPMVACAHCGVHLPTGDALTGARGVYCRAAHRQAREP